MFQWKELHPFKVIPNPPWGNRYIFEMCATCGEKPRIIGDHSWLRLKTPKGEIFSIGIYRPDKNPGVNGHFNNPFKVKKGTLMQPDVSEFWPDNIESLGFEISKTTFQAIKAQVEVDKMVDDGTFQLFQGNCAAYVLKIAKTANITLPLSLPFLRILTPFWLQRLFNAAYYNPFVPEIARKVTYVSFAVLMNLVQVVFGGLIVDEEVVKKVGPHVKPNINSFWDLFDVKKVEILSPYKLGKVMRPYIELMRQKQIHVLLDEKKQLGKCEMTQKTQEQMKLLNSKIEQAKFMTPECFKLVHHQGSATSAIPEKSWAKQ